MPEVTDTRAELIRSDPYCETLGIEIVSLAPGYAKTELSITEELLNFHGTPHGGAVYSLADAAFAAASNAAGQDAVALETNISYLEAVSVGDRLVATAKQTHAGGRTAEYEVAVTAGADSTGTGDRVATFRGRVYRL